MEDYVTFEQAIKLKELGFDWECDYVYCCNFIVKYEQLQEINKKEIISAPTLAQAQKWLREVMGIHITADTYYPRYREGDYKNPYYVYGITLLSSGRRVKCDVVRGIFYNSYEQALSAGLDKAIELLK